MINAIKIPEQRKGVLIGKNGSVKKEIEERTKTTLTIDEDIEIEGESLDVLKSKEIVKAIGRGFSPEIALKLLDDDYRLIVISLGNETVKKMKRMFSRIIGREGKCKRKIEFRTNTNIEIYGKTVSIIGNWENADKANVLVELLLKGKPHAYVYKRLEDMTS